MPFFTTFLLVVAGKAQTFQIKLMMALFYLSLQISCVNVSQHAQYWGPDTEAASWNLAIVDFIFMPLIYTVTCQNFFCVKGLLWNFCDCSLFADKAYRHKPMLVNEQMSLLKNNSTNN